MKPRTEISVLFITALLGALILSAGCAKKTGIEQQAKTTSSMGKVESNIQQAAAKIDETNSSLNNLISGQPADLKNSFEMYSEKVDEMDDAGKQLLSQMNEMSSQGNQYFEEWRKEGQAYVNPEIRQLSEERRLELSRAFTNVADASIGVRGALTQYLSEIKEIQTYLSNNLTGESVSAIASVAQKTMADGSNLKQQLKPVQTAIDQARSQMAVGSGGAAAGGAGSGQSQENMQSR